MRGITGDDTAGDLKAFADPISVFPPSTCGYLQLRTESWGGIAGNDPIRFDFTVKSGADVALTGDLGVNDFAEYFTLPTGADFTLDEVIPPGAPWMILTVGCQAGDGDQILLWDNGVPTGNAFTIEPRQMTGCIIFNATSLATVHKATKPADATQKFGFNVNGTPVELGNGESHTLQVLPGTEVSMQETQVQGWSLTGVSCPNAQTQPLAGGIRVTTQAGQEAACVFTNEQLGTISITKASRNNAAPNDQTLFGWAVSRSGSAVHAGAVQIGDTDEVSSLPGDGFTLAETIPQGAPWSVWSVVCTLGQQVTTLVDNGQPTGQTFSVEAAATTACVITNRHALDALPPDPSEDPVVAAPRSLPSTGSSVLLALPIALAMLLLGSGGAALAIRRARTPRAQ